MKYLILLLSICFFNLSFGQTEVYSISSYQDEGGLHNSVGKITHNTNENSLVFYIENVINWKFTINHINDNVIVLKSQNAWGPTHMARWDYEGNFLEFSEINSRNSILFFIDDDFMDMSKKMDIKIAEEEAAVNDDLRSKLANHRYFSGSDFNHISKIERPKIKSDKSIFLRLYKIISQNFNLKIKIDSFGVVNSYEILRIRNLDSTKQLQFDSIVNKITFEPAQLLLPEGQFNINSEIEFSFYDSGECEYLTSMQPNYLSFNRQNHRKKGVILNYNENETQSFNFLDEEFSIFSILKNLPSGNYVLKYWYCKSIELTVKNDRSMIEFENNGLSKIEMYISEKEGTKSYHYTFCGSQKN